MIGALQPIIERLRAATARERAGLAVLAAALAVALAFSAFDWAQSASADLIAARQRLQHAYAIEASVAGAERQDAIAEAAGAATRAALNGADDVDESFLLLLEEAAAQAGLLDSEIVLIDPKDTDRIGRVRRVTAAFSADMDWRAYVELLRAFQDVEPSLVVTALEIAEGESGQRFSLMVSAPVIAAEEDAS